MKTEQRVLDLMGRAMGRFEMLRPHDRMRLVCRAAKIACRCFMRSSHTGSGRRSRRNSSLSRWSRESSSFPFRLSETRFGILASNG